MRWPPRVPIGMPTFASLLRPRRLSSETRRCLHCAAGRRGPHAARGLQQNFARFKLQVFRYFSFPYLFLVLRGAAGSARLAGGPHEVRSRIRCVLKRLSAAARLALGMGIESMANIA